MPELRLRPAAWRTAPHTARCALRTAWYMVHVVHRPSRVVCCIVAFGGRLLHAASGSLPEAGRGSDTLWHRDTCLPAFLHHPAQPRPGRRPDWRGRIWPGLIPPHRHRDRLGCVVCAALQHPAPCCEPLGTLRRAAASAAAIDAHSVARASRPVARRALHRVACVSSARTLHRRLSAVLLHARRAPGQHREGRQAEPGPVARHGGCARRAAQRATCNAQHETCNVQHETCSMQRATCNVQQAACSRQLAASSMQHATRNQQLATCAIVGCNGQVSTDATQLSA